MQRSISMTELEGSRAKAILDSIWGNGLDSPGLGSCEDSYIRDREELMRLVGKSVNVVITVSQIS